MVEELGLKAGQIAYAIIKASGVMIGSMVELRD